MEYLIFGICCFAFILAMICRGIYLDRKNQRIFVEKLRKDYGVLRKREYSLERFLRMDRYFRKHEEADQIDDITWNDLGMDELFKGMNHTYSSIGEEYLYYRLRNAGTSLEELNEFESLVAFFKDQEEARVSFQAYMAKLGYMGNFSLYDYLDHLDYLGERSNVSAYVRNAIFFGFCLLMPFAFSYALIGMVVMLIVNNLCYFKEKSEIEPYVISFVYILKLLDCSEKIEKNLLKDKTGNKQLQCEIQRLKSAREELKPLRKGSFWVMYGNGALGGDPAGMLLDLLKMGFHIDLIRFNRMLSFLKKHIDGVDVICTCLGKMETAVAIGAYRTDLGRKNGYCIPELREENEENGNLSIRISEGYHPLLETPIKNTIEAHRGVLLTGSNASGKSTFLKMVAINAIFAQTIHTCTAGEYQSPMFRILSSMALRDDLQGGDSYYIVEIKALKRILVSAGEGNRPVLCFVDEVLRGTNTVERIAASTEILKSLSRKNTLCFAATHDIELTELLEEQYDNYHFTEEIRDGDIEFPYLLLKGKATTRNAIKLLEIIGYDEEIISRAEKLAEKFIAERTWK